MNMISSTGDASFVHRGKKPLRKTMPFATDSQILFISLFFSPFPPRKFPSFTVATFFLYPPIPSPRSAPPSTRLHPSLRHNPTPTSHPRFRKLHHPPRQPSIVQRQTRHALRLKGKVGVAQREREGEGRDRGVVFRVLGGVEAVEVAGALGLEEGDDVGLDQLVGLGGGGGGLEGMRGREGGGGPRIAEGRLL